MTVWSGVIKDGGRGGFTSFRFELDNRGHRLIVTDDCAINTPAVAAAYAVRRYAKQAQDEISFEVGTKNFFFWGGKIINSRKTV